MKKNLLVFDLNQTLLYAGKKTNIKTFDYKDRIMQQKPHTTIDKHQIYFRPGRNDFLNYLFLRSESFFDVGIWSSLDKDKTSQLSKAFFERYYRKY